MKKKKIEAIPFKRPARLKKNERAGEVQVVNIDGETHLFVDIWEDKEPYCRYVCCSNGYGHYYPEGRWDAMKWGNSYSHLNVKLYHEENALIFAEEIGSAEKKLHWIIQDQERDIQLDRDSKKALRRTIKLEHRCSTIKPLPEGFDKYVERMLDESRLYYHRHGRNADIYCTHCGFDYTVAIKATDSYEGQFEYIAEKPVHGQLGKCLHCGHFGIYKAAGIEKNGSTARKNIYLAQTTTEGALVIRYFECWKEFYPMLEERVGYEEITRTFISDKGVQRDYHKLGCYTGQTFWDDCNLAGMANITMKEGCIHPATEEALKESYMKYIPVDKLINMGEINLAELCIICKNWPQMEMLVKLGFNDTVRYIIRNKGYCQSRYITSAKKPWEFFGIKKNRLELLQQSERLLSVLRAEKELNADWSEQLIWMLEGLSREDIVTISRYMSTQKAINRIYKYAGLSTDADAHSRDRYKIKHWGSLFADYLVMKDAAGFDMTNSVYLHPRNLERAHEELVERKEELEDEMYIKKKEAQYPNIAKQYRKANRHFRFEDDNLIIRPARTAAEIIREGREQHHCVGGDTYLSKHNLGTTYILLLRFQDSKRSPYYTVEMDWDYNVKQFYAAHDKQPNREEIEHWLKEYKAHMIGQTDAAVSEKAS